ncbi:serralysin family metalloprotease [Pseudomonas sp. Xaverov 259]|uniref:serralysin family metalloprotease n=1 Tax=Pseudomonas sp. Xaverov 259 TaxID=2666086 RepID=UPI001C5B4806|nr:serralysin family metalloprotease [Pseudomonas sp. Xaverov 259]
MSKIKIKTTAAVAAQSSDAFNKVESFSHQYDRGGNVLINGKPSYTADQAADAILRDGGGWKDLNGNGTVELTYKFLTAPTAQFSSFGVGGFSQFTAAQKAQSKLSMQSWADVAKVTFTEQASGGEGQVTFGNYAYGLNGAGAFAVMPGLNYSGEGQSYYNSGQPGALNPIVGSYARQTLTHEIGHAIGLHHPGDYNAGTGPTPTYNDVTYAQDTRGYSLMSYWTEANTGQNFTKGGVQAYASGPLIDDIAAIQQLYGANTSTRTGDSVYGFNSNTGRDFLTATSNADKLVFSVWDAGGNDTLDFSGFTQNQKINLNAGSFSDVGGLVGNVSIAQGVTLENATGGSGHDLLIGNAVANTLRGGAGNDILFGGGGADKLWGGTGADIFVFGASSDSKPVTADKIFDFTSGSDKIDLTGLTHGSGLHFVSAFTGAIGDAVLTFASATNLGTLAVDFSGQGVADFLVTTVGQAYSTDIAA